MFGVNMTFISSSEVTFFFTSRDEIKVIFTQTFVFSFYYIHHFQ